MSIKSYVFDVLRSPATKPWWPWIFASPFLLVLFEYLVVAPVGSKIFLWPKLFFALGILAAIIAIVVLPILLVFGKFRKVGVAWLLASLCYLPLAIGGIIIGKKVRNSAFHDLAERSKPLVSAIEDYNHDHGEPPASLSQLVPDYLAEVTSTGMMAYSEYRYEVGDEAKLYEGNPWILTIYTTSGGINFDEFMYFPLQNYPDQGYGGSFKRIGDWAYLYE